MRTHMSRYAFLVILSVMLWATESMAYTIGFNYLPGSNLSSFSSYTENNYTVSARPGDSWFVAKIFGDAIPAIGAGPVYSSDQGVSQITVTEGGEQFTFQGLDLSSNVAGGTTYTIAGFLGASGVFSETFRIDSINTFETKLFSSIGNLNIDKLTITGTRAAGVTSFNIDNIRAGDSSVSCATPDPNCTVPEPTSILFFAAGLAGLEIWRRNRCIG